MYQKIAALAAMLFAAPALLGAASSAHAQGCLLAVCNLPPEILRRQHEQLYQSGVFPRPPQTAIRKHASPHGIAIHGNILPPVEFDRPYRSRLIVRTRRQRRAMKTACRWPPSHPVKLGCAHAGVAQCVVYLRGNAEIRRQGWTRQIVLRHEIGHCNGWPGGHRGMRPIVRSATR